MAFSHGISLIPFSQALKNYGVKSLRHDLCAAMVVALLTIPQAIAYSLLAGLPVSAGIFSAIFGTLFTAAWGSSQHLISGPSTGVAVLLQASISDTISTFFPGADPALRQTLALQILMHLILLMSVIQILFAFCNGSKLLQFVSKSVMLGYFAGVAAAIVVGQLGNFLGISGNEEGAILFQAIYVLRHLPEMSPLSLVFGGFSLFLLVIFRKRFPLLPDALLMLGGVGLVAYAINSFASARGMEIPIATLRDVGSFALPIPDLSLPLIDFKVLARVFPQAAALALLGILEVFSVSRALSAKSGQRTNSNQEVFAIGISNFFLSFFHYSMPSSGSMSRSLLNYHVKGKSRLSAVFSSVFVLILLFALFPLIAHIPMASLAALLFRSATYLVEKEQVKLCFKATRGDALVFLLTLGSCLVLTLDIAFFIGIGISLASYLRKAAIPHFVEYAFNDAGRLSVINPSDKKHRRVRIIGIGGELFFASVDILQNALHAIAEDPYVKVIVLRLHGVYHMDASMCLAILRLHSYLRETDRHLVISGLTPEVWRVFYKSSLVEKIGAKNLFVSDEAQPQLSTWKACLRAQELII